MLDSLSMYLGTVLKYLRTVHMYGQIEELFHSHVEHSNQYLSHSIYMLSIQNDTKNLELDFHHFNNIKLSFFASQTKLGAPLYVRLFDTIE